jgi:hypothetical protein
MMDSVQNAIVGALRANWVYFTEPNTNGLKIETGIIVSIAPSAVHCEAKNTRDDTHRVGAKASSVFRPPGGSAVSSATPGAASAAAPPAAAFAPPIPVQPPAPVVQPPAPVIPKAPPKRGVRADYDPEAWRKWTSDDETVVGVPKPLGKGRSAESQAFTDGHEALKKKRGQTPAE